MESAHVLELPQKMQYGPELYTAVNSTLYRYFAIVGGVYQIGSIIAAGALTFLVRRQRRIMRRTRAGAVLLLLSFVVWCGVVAPVNSEVAETTLTNPEAVARLWRPCAAVGNTDTRPVSCCSPPASARWSYRCSPTSRQARATHPALTTGAKSQIIRALNDLRTPAAFSHA